MHLAITRHDILLPKKKKREIKQPFAAGDQAEMNKINENT